MVFGWRDNLLWVNSGTGHSPDTLARYDVPVGAGGSVTAAEVERACGSQSVVVGNVAIRLFIQQMTGLGKRAANKAATVIATDILPPHKAWGRIEFYTVHELSEAVREYQRRARAAKGGRGGRPRKPGMIADMIDIGDSTGP